MHRPFVATPELKPIRFAFDRADVQRQAAAIVDANAAWLRAHPDYSILVAGTLIRGASPATTWRSPSGGRSCCAISWWRAACATTASAW